MVTFPAAFGISSRIAFIRVDFPAPFGPIIPMSFHSDSFVGVERIGRGLGSRKFASVELKLNLII